MSDDEEIGGPNRFNRLSGSDSSSREGSLRAKRPRRAFTPNSDDGDLVVKPVGEHIDDTPPPEGHPIIRQAVAFNWNQTATTNVHTYEATPPAPVASYFLPGQAPVTTPTPPLPNSGYSVPAPTQRPPSPSRPPPLPQPPQPRQKSTSRKKKIEKTRHFNDSFATQTGRFKVGPGFVHDPNVVEAPVTTRGSGPYSSLYRMETASPTPSAVTLTDMTSPSAAPGGRSQSFRIPASTVPTPTPSGSRPPSSKQRGSNKHSSNAGKAAQTIQIQTSNLTPNYYRHGSNTGAAAPGPSKQKATSGTTKSRSSKASASSSARNNLRIHEPREEIPRTRSPTSTSSGDNHGDRAEPGQQGQGPPRQLRMLTLLIADIRSGVTDHQLAEVRVPLRDHSGYYWADAQDVCEQLQSSPSRIDGPARVYTIRSNYRQFFLRVSEENVDEVTSANLQVFKDKKALDIVVEALPQRGVLPQPPQIPRELLSPSSDNETIDGRISPTPLNANELRVAEALRQLESVPQKRRRSISPSEPRRRQFGHISPYQSPSSSPAPSLIHLPSRASRRGSKSSSSGYDYSRMSPRSAHYYQTYARDYRIPLPAAPNALGRMGETEEQVDGAILRFIKPIVQEDDGWMLYMASKAKPPRVSEILKQYRFVQAKVDELEGTRTPIHWADAPGQLIEAKHIWNILNMESPPGPDCHETLGLLRLYGPGGRRYEDSRVAGMMEDKDSQGKPYKRFLKLLRQIDEDWLREHPEDAESEGSGGGSISGEGRDNDSMSGSNYDLRT